jgi:ABC-type molybdate transport system substrate-binding protein
MKRKIIALLMALVLLIPVLAAAETAVLPFGLALGMDGEQVSAAFAADPALAALKPDFSDWYNGAVEYSFENVPIPGTALTAESLYVQIDRNNSQMASRLSTVSFSLMPTEDNIAAFREALAALEATLGAPESDPFGADAVEAYVEWGTLSASWSTESLRIALNLNRMYEESITLQYTSRLNYDKADLGL